MSAVERFLQLLQEEEISEVMINSPRDIFFERGGKVFAADFRFDSVEQIMDVMKQVARPTGGRTDWEGPIVTARLADGSRVHAVLSPIVLGGGPSITIRKFLPSRLSLKAMVQSGALSDEMAFFLSACVAARLNLVISGGTSSGKTTLLNCLSTCIDAQERLVTIEDTAELKLRSKNIVRLECQTGGSSGENVVSMRDLLRSALRMRPDRIIVGETRGAEAMDMLQAMNTGHEGSMTTVHANSPRDCLSRIETMSLMSAISLPLEALRRQIASSVDIVIQLQKQRDGSRKVVSISEVCGMEGAVILTQEIFQYAAMGTAPDQSVLGKFTATGIVPRCLSRFQEKGIDFPKDFFSGVYRVAMSTDTPSKLPARKK